MPPPLAPPRDPLAALRAQHVARGLALTARTGLPLWYGEGLNVGWAIDVLHPLANPVSPPRPRDDVGAGRCTSDVQ